MQSSTLLQAANIEKSVLSGETALTILNGVSLTLQPGESIAILGASGSGKSTLLAILAGLDLPTKGEVTLLTQSLTHLNEDDKAQLRRGQVSFIFQSFHLVPSLTALENVMLPLELADSKSAVEQAKHWLQRVGLAARAHHYPHQLSGGEQQRVAIARAFAIKPKILFADEPTGNLDKRNSQHIAELLQTINQEQNTALVLVTHDEALADICRHKFTLEDGRLYVIA